MARAPLDMKYLEHAVRWASIPENQGTRAEMIRYLEKEIQASEQEGAADPNLPTLRAWLQSVQAVQSGA